MKNLDNFVEEMRKVFVSLERYELEIPQLKGVVYGAVGLVLLGVMGAWISLVVRGIK